MRVWRFHHQNDQRQCSYGVLRWVLVWISVCYIVFTIGPPSRWRLKQSPCPQCDDCYCSSAEYPLVSQDCGKHVCADCGKHDPTMNVEMNKDQLTMLSEELKLQKVVANETLEHTKRLVTNARNTFAHYKTEAEKCNIGMETCEEARERAEAELVEERRLTAIWENRARDYGWKDTR